MEQGLINNLVSLCDRFDLGAEIIIDNIKGISKNPIHWLGKSNSDRTNNK